MGQRFRRRRHAPQAPFVEGESGFLGGRPSLDLHEGHDPAAPGDEVDLADGGTHPSAEDLPPLELEPERRQPFRPPASLLRPLPRHLSFSARS
jgi:hypothetical protein